jgi:hypothetical protein
MQPQPPPPAPVGEIRAHRDTLRDLGEAHGLEQLWVVADGLVVAAMGHDPADYLAVVEFEREAEVLLDGYVAVVPLPAYEREPFGDLTEL